MADSRSIVITLKLDTESNSTDTSNQTSTKNASAKSDRNALITASATLAAVMVVKEVSADVANWAVYYNNMYTALNDDYIGQRNKQIATTQINRAVSYAGKIGSFGLAGMQLGATIGGPWGAALGAIVGTVAGGVFAAADINHSNAQGRREQEIKIKQMDMQLGYTRSRAGWSLKAASIGEDL